MWDVSASPRSFSALLRLQQPVSLHSSPRIHFAQRLAAAHLARGQNPSRPRAPALPLCAVIGRAKKPLAKLYRQQPNNAGQKKGETAGFGRRA